MPTKAELANTAVAVGIITPSEAKSLRKAEIEERLNGVDLSNMETSPTGGIPGDPKREVAGSCNPVPQVGHILIVKADQDGTPLKEGDFLTITAMDVDAEGNLVVEDAEGNQYTMTVRDLQQYTENTSIAAGDVIQDRHGFFYAVYGVAPRSRKLGVRPFVRFNSLHDESLTPIADDEDYKHPRNMYLMKKEVPLDLSDVNDHWSFRPGTTYEFRQEALDWFGRMQALTTNDAGIDPVPGAQFPVGLGHTESGVGTPILNGAFPYVDARSDDEERVIREAGFPPGGVRAQFWPHTLGPDLLMAAAKRKMRGNIVDLGIVMSYLPITMLEAHQPEMEAQGENEGDHNLSDPKTKEGIMEQSRRTLADMKGTPDTPKKASVSSEKIRELVEETVANTDSLEEAVGQVIERKKNALRDVLGVNEDLKRLGEATLEDIEQAFKEYAREQDEWRRDVEQKVTSRVEFHVPDMPPVTITDPHMNFDDLVANCALRKPTLLVGPSGSGKTTAMRQVAEMFDLPFSYVALGPTQTEAKFAGYPDATGHYIPTEFYLRYRYGGVMGLDEMDAGNPSVLVWINGAIQNKIASFPRGFMTKLEEKGFNEEAEDLREAGGMIHMHPDCIIIASANTYGKGADLIYQGRNALDGATLKRFKVITWDYDEVLERKLAGDDLWTSFVQEIRAAVSDIGLEHIVSPVDSIDGAQMIAAGIHWQKVVTQTVFAGLKAEDIKKIMREPSHHRTITELKSKLDERQKEVSA